MKLLEVFAHRRSVSVSYSGAVTGSWLVNVSGDKWREPEGRLEVGDLGFTSGWHRWLVASPNGVWQRRSG